MLTQPLAPSAVVTKAASTAAPTTSDRLGLFAGHAGLVASEFTYRKDEEIYGEDEPAEYVYQVIRGAVRSYKLLSDGRRQIGAFHLPGDVFGLETGQIHRLGDRSHRRHHGAPGEASLPGTGGAERRAGRA